jgi:hypothetical protein
MTYTELEARQKDGGGAYPLLRFRAKTAYSVYGPHNTMFQRWRIHGDNGWYEEWIEVPEMER